IPEIPQSVENIVLQATAKDPFHRYESVFDMETALDIALDPSVRDEAVYSPPEEAGESTKAIPIITDEQLNGTDDDATLVHNEQETTKDAPGQPTDVHEEAENPTKTQRSYTRQWFIFLMRLFSMIVGGIIYFVASTPKLIHMPDVVNEEYDDAKET